MMIIGQGSTEDAKAPSVTSYQLPAYAIDLSNGDVELSSTAQFTDDFSGFEYASVRWLAPTTNQSFVYNFTFLVNFPAQFKVEGGHALSTDK